MDAAPLTANTPDAFVAVRAIEPTGPRDSVAVATRVHTIAAAPTARTKGVHGAIARGFTVMASRAAASITRSRTAGFAASRPAISSSAVTITFRALAAASIARTSAGRVRRRLRQTAIAIPTSAPATIDTAAIAAPHAAADAASVNRARRVLRSIIEETMASGDTASHPGFESNQDQHDRPDHTTVVDVDRVSTRRRRRPRRAGPRGELLIRNRHDVSRPNIQFGRQRVRDRSKQQRREEFLGSRAADDQQPSVRLCGADKRLAGAVARDDDQPIWRDGAL